MQTKEQIEKSHMVFVRDTNSGIISRIAFPEDVQVGLSNKPSELMLTGRLSLSTTNYTCEPGNEITINNDTIYALVSATSSQLGNLTVKLPASPRNGQWVIIKDASGNASNQNIIVKPQNNSIKIDGLTQSTITSPYGSFAVIWNDGEWKGAFGLGLSGDGTPGGADTYVQFNDVGAFGGESSFTYNKTTNTLTVDNLSGSLTRLSNGSSYLVAGTGITISTGSSGQVTITNAASSITTLEWNERLSGAVDGVNKIFTLAHAPMTSQSIMVFLNGILLESGAGNDFTIAGSTVTLSEAPLPDSKIIATYSR